MVDPVAAVSDAPPERDVARAISLSQTVEALHNDAKSLLRQLLPRWNAFDDQDIQVCKISGGITNVLLKLSPPEGSQQSAVAMRVFGDKTEDLIDRTRELRILRILNANGFGAPVLGTFENGRVETFIPYHPLTDSQLSDPQISSAVAVRLAQLHAVSLSDQRTGELFGMLYRWLHGARQLKMKTEKSRRVFEEFDLAEMEGQVTAVEEACMALESPIVCSHNDLLAGNILIPDREGQLGADGEPQQAMQFIDFEYSCHMHRAYDWGNHFNEWAGFEGDYTRYPRRSQAEHFLRHYLTEAEGRQPTDSDVREAAVEADTFSLASHQFWGTWCLYQAASSAIDFDYLAYAKVRWDEYRRQKGSRLEAAAELVASRRRAKMTTPS